MKAEGEKVALWPSKKNPHAWQAPGCCETDLVACLPFFKSAAGKLTHRVRSGTIYWRDGEFRHVALKFYCGNNGFPGDKGWLLMAPGPEARLCAVCEAKAGNGRGQQLSSRPPGGRQFDCATPVNGV